MKFKRNLVSKVLFVVLLLVISTGVLASNYQNGALNFEGNSPKYVFLFIGDGMSYAQISSAEMFLGNSKKFSVIETEGLNFTSFPVTGVQNTFDRSSFIPDSASTASAMASGIKTLAGVINMDVSKTIEYTPITETLKNLGFKIGIVSSVPITHATPAAFYAKVPHRNNTYDIALQLANSGFDYFAGGSFQRLDGPEGNIFDVLAENGYKVVNEKEDIINLTKRDGKVVAISPVLDGAALPYELDRKPGELSLADFTRKGIELLSNETGFFMMVESGKIDWAGHANDAAASIHDTIAFARAIEEAIKFYQNNPEDTLIIVTGDHECGGLTIGFAGTGYETFFEKIERVKMSNVEFNKILNEYKNNVSSENAILEDLELEIEYAYGLLFPDNPNARFYPNSVLNDYEIRRLRAAFEQSLISRNERNYTIEQRLSYGGYEPLTITLTHILNNKAGLHYTSFAHTALPVPVFAKGAGSELFNNYYDNTEIYNKLLNILGVN